MNKKFLAIPALLIAIGGGAAFAQSDLFAKAENNTVISASEAKDIALKQVNGEIIDFEYDGDGRTPHYEIDIIKENEKIEVKINANTGDAKITERETIRIAQSETKQPATNNDGSTDTTKPANQPVQPTTGDNKTTAILSKQQAIQIAQSKAPGKVTDLELDEDDNRLVYEIEIRNGKMEYDFEIDAKTGAIIKYEEDLND